MNRVKIFRVKGEIVDPKMRTSFVKEFRALKPEDVAEKLYAELGSRHRVKRHHIRISQIEEIKPEEAKSLIIRKLSESEG